MVGSLSLLAGARQSHQEEMGSGWQPLPHGHSSNTGEDQVDVVKISVPGISGESQDKIGSQVSQSSEKTSTGELMRL